MVIPNSKTMTLIFSVPISLFLALWSHLLIYFSSFFFLFELVFVLMFTVYALIVFKLIKHTIKKKIGESALSKRTIATACGFKLRTSWSNMDQNKIQEEVPPHLALLPFPAVCRMDPSGSTTSKLRTFSFMVPYRTALVPDAPVAAIPHRDASAPGSGK